MGTEGKGGLSGHHEEMLREAEAIGDMSLDEAEAAVDHYAEKAMNQPGPLSRVCDELHEMALARAAELRQHDAAPDPPEVIGELPGLQHGVPEAARQPAADGSPVSDKAEAVIDFVSSREDIPLPANPGGARDEDSVGLPGEQLPLELPPELERQAFHPEETRVQRGSPLSDEAEAAIDRAAKPAAGSLPRLGFPLAAAAVLAVFAVIFAIRQGSGSSKPATGAVPAGATAAGALACSGGEVPAAASIPRDKRGFVGVYCLGDHYYPLEQFTWTTGPGCGGGASFLVTRSGRPASAIDAPGVTLANPRPDGCGYLATSEVPAVVAAFGTRAPSDANNMYPVNWDAYLEWQRTAP